MNNKFLINLLNELSHTMSINEYEEGFSGTIKIAQAYLENTAGYSYSFETNSKINMYYNNKSIGFIKGQTPSTNNKKSLKISNNKYQTESLLRKKNIQTTKSNIFNQDDYFKAKNFVEKYNEYLVIKPNLLSGGRGITLEVNNNNFEQAWDVAINACIDEKKKTEILVQEQLEGIESRFIVINGEFQSAMLRVPANVIGDGKNTINELIDMKNLERKKNPHLKRLPIKKDYQTVYLLSLQNKNLEYIPKNNEIIFLRQSSNVSQGGDNYEISHLVSKRMIELSELSVQAIPGLNTAGIDILYTSFTDPSPKVLEVNPAANLRMHHYPWKGEPKALVHILIESMKNNHSE